MIAYGHRIATTNTVSSAQTQKPSTKATTVAGVSQEGIGLLTAAAPSWPWTGTGCDSASYHNGAAASRSTVGSVHATRRRSVTAAIWSSPHRSDEGLRGVLVVHTNEVISRNTKDASEFAKHIEMRTFHTSIFEARNNVLAHPKKAGKLLLCPAQLYTTIAYTLPKR